MKSSSELSDATRLPGTAFCSWGAELHLLQGLSVLLLGLLCLQTGPFDLPTVVL